MTITIEGFTGDADGLKDKRRVNTALITVSGASPKALETLMKFTLTGKGFPQSDTIQPIVATNVAGNAVAAEVVGISRIGPASYEISLQPRPPKGNLNQPWAPGLNLFALSLTDINVDPSPWIAATFATVAVQAK